MDPALDAPRGGGEAEADAEGPSSSSAAAASSSSKAEEQQQQQQPPGQEAQEAQPLAQQPPPLQLSRYESQKRRDWNTFLQYLRNHKPPLALARCSGANVLEFLRYLDQFGKTKVHAEGCAYFGQPNPPAPCACPLRQAWGSLDALIGRLRAAYEESGGRPESNPFAARAVRIYLREVREAQAKARGIPYEKKKRKRGGGASTAAPAPQPSAGTGDATETSGRGQDPAQQTATVAPPSTGSTRTSASASASTSGSASAAAAATTTMAATEREARVPEPEGSAPGS